MTINYYICIYQSNHKIEDNSGIFIFPFLNEKLETNGNLAFDINIEDIKELYKHSQVYNKQIIKLSKAQIMDWKLSRLPWWHYEKKINNKVFPWNTLDIIDRF